MLRFCFPSLLALTLLAPAAHAAEGFACNPDGNQSELNACAADDFRKADQELNAAYQALVKKEAGDRVFVSKLRQAQKAWLAFRDAELEARFACAEKDIRICWGSLYPMLFHARQAALTRDRTRQLQQLLKDGTGQ